jgi:hypothetical protein
VRCGISHWGEEGSVGVLKISDVREVAERSMRGLRGGRHHHLHVSVILEIMGSTTSRTRGEQNEWR